MNGSFLTIKASAVRGPACAGCPCGAGNRRPQISNWGERASAICHLYFHKTAGPLSARVISWSIACPAFPESTNSAGPVSCNNRIRERNVARYFWDSCSGFAIYARIARAQEQEPSRARVAELIRLAGFQQNGVELPEDEFFMRGANRALALHDHENMVVVFMIVHVVLDVGLAVDYPEISQLGSPQA